MKPIADHAIDTLKRLHEDGHKIHSAFLVIKYADGHMEAHAAIDEECKDPKVFLKQVIVATAATIEAEDLTFAGEVALDDDEDAALDDGEPSN